MAEAGRAARKRRLTPEKARRIIEDTVASILDEAGHALPHSSIRDYFTSWLKEKESAGAQTTFVRYEGVVTRFLEWLGARADDSLTSLTKREILNFRDSRSGQVTPATINVELKILRAALARAVREQIIDQTPAALVENLKHAAKHSRRAFRMDELKRLLEEADSEWRTMILVGLYTGLRLGDVAALTWQNVDLQQEELSLVTGKTGRSMIIPIARPLLHHLEKLAGDDPKAPLCPKSHGADVGSLSNGFYQLMAQVGLVPPRTHKRQISVTLRDGKTHSGQIQSETRVKYPRLGKLRLALADGKTLEITKQDIEDRTDAKGRAARRTLNEISFHALRHTATSLLKNAGASDAVAMDIIGHETKAVSQEYTHIEMETKRRAINAMPDVVKLIEQPELGLSPTPRTK